MPVLTLPLLQLLLDGWEDWSHVPDNKTRSPSQIALTSKLIFIAFYHFLESNTVIMQIHDSHQEHSRSPV